jgi:hypothetical protein
MTAKTQALTEKAMKLGQAIYEKEQAAAAPAALVVRPMTMAWSTPSSRKWTRTRADLIA